MSVSFSFGYYRYDLVDSLTLVDSPTTAIESLKMKVSSLVEMGCEDA